MFYPFKKGNWSFFVSLLCVLTFLFVVGAHGAGACGKNGCTKTCKHKLAGQNCPTLMKAASEAGSQEQKSGALQALSLEAFSKVEQYACPMHHEVRIKKSGKCPECGMKLMKEDFYEVYRCAMKECPQVSAKAGKCCGKDLQKTLMSKDEIYESAQLQDEYFCPMHSDVVSAELGKCPKCGMKLEMRTVQKAEEESPETVSYVCPMHPEQVSDRPGKCSKCSMLLKERETTAEEKTTKL